MKGMKGNKPKDSKKGGAHGSTYHGNLRKTVKKRGEYNPKP